MKGFVNLAAAIVVMTTATGSFHQAFGEEAAPSAAKWRAMAVDAIKTVEDDALRSQLWYEATYVFVRAGELDEALQAASSVAPPQQRIYAHAQVAKGFRDAGNAEAALAALDACRESVLGASAKERTDWIGYMVRAYAEAGFIEEARELAAQMKKVWQRDNALQDIARIVAQAGDLDRARALLEAQEADDRQQAGLALMVASLASSRQTDEALAAAKSLETSESSDHAFQNLAEELTRTRRYAEAEQAAARIAAPATRQKAVGEIEAERIAEADAQTIESRITAAATREEKTPLYELLIKRLAADGEIEAAEEAVASMVAMIDASPREPAVSAFGKFDDQLALASAVALRLEIAKALAKSGDLDAARQQLAKVADAVLPLAPETGMGKSMLIMGLLKAQVETVDLDSARRLLEQLPAGHDRTLPATVVANALLDAGDIAGGVAVAQQIKPSRGRGHGVGSIAGKLIHAGELAGAKNLLASLGDGIEDVAGYRGAGEAMTATGRGAELVEWLPAMPSAAARAFACLGAAERRTGPAQKLAPGH